MVPPEVIQNHSLCKLFFCILEIITKKIKINNLLCDSQIWATIRDDNEEEDDISFVLHVGEYIEYLVWKRREHSLWEKSYEKNFIKWNSLEQWEE